MIFINLSSCLEREMNESLSMEDTVQEDKTFRFFIRLLWEFGISLAHFLPRAQQ